MSVYPLNNLNDTNRIQARSKYILVEGKLIEQNHYTRFIQPKTELWMFGVGLGDQAIMQQVGETFLDMPDPALGRIMLSMGVTATAFYPYKGDWNLWWAWGDRPDWISYYLSKVTVKPQLYLCGSKRVQDEINQSATETLYCPLGVGDRFKPLHLKRAGLGYSGSDAKTPEQKRLILNPFIERADFEWHSRKLTDEYFTLDKLNHWYNTKQVLFGMVNENCSVLDVVPNRVYETFASGTPLVMTAHPGFMETFGFKQPYAAEKEGDAERHVQRILGNPEQALKECEELSLIIRTRHHYSNRLSTIFNRLKEMRR